MGKLIAAVLTGVFLSWGIVMNTNAEAAERGHFAMGNISADPLDATDEEMFEDILVMAPGEVAVERIFSEGQASPDGFWYDQSWDEWVMIMTGGAVLELKDPEKEVKMGPGDWVYLPANCVHRVKSTEKKTLWLAIHVGERE
ncbi:MAG: cupin domain-containing protein [Planctomycetota bacterium]|nr:cupin domain-containing protein [Planctomycetota bacterium]